MNKNYCQRQVPKLSKLKKYSDKKLKTRMTTSISSEAFEKKNRKLENER